MISIPAAQMLALYGVIDAAADNARNGLRTTRSGFERYLPKAAPRVT